MSCYKQAILLLAVVLMLPQHATANSPAVDIDLDTKPPKIIIERSFEIDKNEQSKPIVKARKELKGWDYLYHELRKHGFSDEMLTTLFRDRRIPRWKTIYYSLDPKERRYRYRKHNTRKSRKNAISFYEKHWRTFKQASIAYGVPESVLLAILQVETKCGNYTGKSRVFHRLARLASAAAPKNVEANYRKKWRQDKRITLDKVQARGQWLENTFLPHVVATLRYAEERGIDPLELRGSPAGAIGLPQFLPGNVFHFGIDGNTDGIVDLFSPIDAIFSVANFLNSHGWVETTTTTKAQEKVIWHYNASLPYVQTVLTMAGDLEPKMRAFEHTLADQAIDAPLEQVIPVRLAPGH